MTDPYADLRAVLADAKSARMVAVYVKDVAALLAERVPDGHARIDGKLYRVTMFDRPSLNGNQAWLVPVEGDR